MNFKEYNVDTPFGPITIIPNGPSTFYVSFDNLTVRKIVYRGSIHLKDNGQTVENTYIRRPDKLYPHDSPSFPTFRLIKETIVGAVAKFKNDYPTACDAADYVIKYNEALQLLESVKELKKSLDDAAHQYDGLRRELEYEHPARNTIDVSDKERLVPLA